MKANRTGRFSRPSPRSSARSRRVSGRRNRYRRLPILHDTPGEIAQDQVKDWKKGECDLIPGKTAPNFVPVERDYPNLYNAFTALGPLDGQAGQWRQGHHLEHRGRGAHLRDLNGLSPRRRRPRAWPKIETDIDACEVILMLAPETNGEVAVKAWEALSKPRASSTPIWPARSRTRKSASATWRPTAQDHFVANMVRHREREGLLQRRVHQRARTDPVAHPDGPSAALSGSSVDAGVRRGLRVYRPPVDLKTINRSCTAKSNGKPHVVLNFITPHQKWGIHSTYSDNLLMLTLNRGGPVVWLSEVDAQRPASSITTGSRSINSTAPLDRAAVVPSG